MEQIRYGQGGLNTDDSVEIISPDDYPYAANFVSGRSQFSQNGTKELFRGTNVISTSTYLDSNSKFIGGVRSVTDDVYFLCFYNTDAEKNCILKLDNDVVTPVIVWERLNFSPLKEHRINGGGIAGVNLFINDNFNDPRCIHTSRYSVTPPNSEEEILVIKRGPQLPLSFEKRKFEITNTEYTSIDMVGAGNLNITVTTPISGDTPQTGYLIIDGQTFTYQSWVNPDPSFIDGDGYVFFDPVFLDVENIDPTWSYTIGFGVGETVQTGINIRQNLIDQFSFQFAYYYQYEDKQISVLSPYTALCTKSFTYDDYRSVMLTIPDAESIPDLTDEIVFAARINNNGPFFEIGRLKKSGGVFTARQYQYFNNTNGNVLDPFQQNAFSLVPRKAGSMAVSKSRLWLANYLEGYNTPDGIDISATVSATAAEETEGTIYTIYRQHLVTYEYQFVGPYAYDYAWVEIDNEIQMFDTTFQYIIQRGSEFDVVEFDPTSYNSSVIIDRHAGFTDIPKSNYVDDPQTPIIGGTYSVYKYIKFTDTDYPDGAYPSVDFGPDISDIEGKKTFPSDSSYKIGIVFSDSQGRKSGVYTNDNLLLNTPQYQTSRIQIEWSLVSNANIPDWAEYYSIVITKNLKKSFYIENHCIDIQYRKMLTADTESLSYGGIGVDHKDYSEIRINIRNFPYNTLSYSFIEGDRVLLRQAGSDPKDIDLTIKSFDGNYLICERGNTEVTFVADQFVAIEIYRPIFTGGANMLFYEVGQTYRMIKDSNPPEYSVTSGVIEGDSIVVARDIYELVTEVEFEGTTQAFKSISLDGDGTWNTDIGRPFIQTPVGEVQKSAYIRHSGTYIAGTELNALSDFDSGDEGNIPVESGTIQKLQPTHKESVEGDVLLAIANSDTFSLYIDEARVTQGQSSFLIGSTKVIGDIRKQRSGFGTLHPESVLEEDGYVYFFDKLSRAFVRYASNGLFPLSEYKVVTHFETQAQLNDVDDFAVSGYDPYYKVIFVSFTNASTNTKKTIAYSIPKERWLGFVDFAPEGFITGSASMYSVKGGVLYKHNNETNFNRFYGVDYNAAIDYSFNDDPSSTKDWKAIEIGCSPNLYSFSNANQSVITNGLQVDISNRHGQATNILFNEFEVDENVVHADIKGDLNTGGVLEGDPIYSNSILCRTTMIYGANKYLLYVKAGFELGRGHTL